VEGVNELFCLQMGPRRAGTEQRPPGRPPGFDGNLELSLIYADGLLLALFARHTRHLEAFIFHLSHRAERGTRHLN